MMNISNQNLRPGVYSSYTTASRYATPRSAKQAALLVNLSGEYQDKMFIFESYGQADAILNKSYGNQVSLAGCSMLFQLGVKKVVVVAKEEQFDPDVLDELPSDVGVIITDDTNLDYLKKVSSWVKDSSQQGKEKLLFVGAVSATASDTAKALNHERSIVATPATQYQGKTSAIFTATALAGEILAVNKPDYNLNYLELNQLEQIEKLKEKDIQTLIKNGVTVAEEYLGEIRCIRGVTSKTSTNGVEDYSLRSINTMLIIDDVVTTIRQGLEGKLKGIGVSSVSLESIASQVLIELAEKQKESLIESYQLPQVYLDRSDPSVCIVELAFNVAHVVSQIHITAHIGL